LEGERKTVTALFADIKGSTELERDLDPEEARAIVDPVLRLMIDAVHRYGGYVAQSTGDGIFALFGAPIAHEDHPQRALHAALAMQEELHRYAARLRKEGKPAVEARVGLNTGEVVVRTIETSGHTEYTPIGHVTNLAARMQTAAPSGSIAASEATRRLCEGYFEFRTLGPTAIKGLDAPVEVYEVMRAGPLRTHFELSAQRGLTKFVGREREFAELRRALELALNGHGQIVAVVADAGTGKSRLFYEFKATLPPGCKVLEAYSVSHGKASAWLPVLNLLHTYFGIEGVDAPPLRREKLSTKLAALDPALSDTLPYLFGLLGIQETPDPLAQMNPQVRGRRTLEAIKRIMLHESLNHPLVIVFEDLHWIDDHTQALLDLLADSIGNARIFLLVNYRPEYRHTWNNKSYYSQLRLDALDREGAVAMLTALLGETAELSSLKQLIVERTQGNPFFIEEMVQALFEEGALTRNGEVKIRGSLTQLKLPPTVQGLLASRIDRLPSEQKQLLQMLAMVGRASSLALIKSLTSVAEQQTEQLLADLQSGEFVYEQPTATDMQYVFKHALTQEVAYNSILIERRKLLHERVGQIIETVYAVQLDDHVAALARHYSRSDNVEKAVEYLGRAGQQAIQRSAYADAVSSLSAAIDLLQRLPDTPERARREVRLELAIAPALIAVKGWGAPETHRAYIRVQDLSSRLRDPQELFYASHGVWLMHFIRAEMATALDAAKELLRQAEATSDKSMLAMVHCGLGETLYHMGQPSRAKEHLEISLSLEDPRRPLAPPDHIFLKVSNLSYLSWVLWHLGYPDQARKCCDAAVASAEALSHPHSIAFGIAYAIHTHFLRGELGSALALGERLYALSSEHGLTDFLAAADGVRGFGLVARGDEKGLPVIEKNLASMNVTGLKMVRPHVLCGLASAYIQYGRFDEAISALEEAKTIAEEGEDRYCEPQASLLMGELLLERNKANTQEAQTCFERAVELARNRSCKSMELQATKRLARLLDTQGRRDEARAMLAEIYNWFTEGFDTANLKDAKALLEKLSA
jgi:class 3 adenylate cyclase/tetratricopeptide (TPR) repeat protein